MSNIKTEFHQSGNSLGIKREQDVEGILKDNIEDAKHEQSNSNIRRVANIPNIIVEQWLKEGVNIFDPNCRDEVKKRLNSPEWRYLRTHNSRL